MQCVFLFQVMFKLTMKNSPLEQFLETGFAVIEEHSKTFAQFAVGAVTTTPIAMWFLGVAVVFLPAAIFFDLRTINFSTFLWAGLAIGIVLYVFVVKDDWQQIGKLRASLDLENRRLVIESEMPNVTGGVYTRYIPFDRLILRRHRRPECEGQSGAFVLRLLTAQDQFAERSDLAGYLLHTVDISIDSFKGSVNFEKPEIADTESTALAEKFCVLTAIRYLDATVVT